MNRTHVLIGGTAITLAVTGVAVAVVAPDDTPAVDPTATPSDTTDASDPSPTEPDVAVSEAGVTLSLPDGWQQLASDDPQVLLVATPNGRDSVLVREVDLTVEVTAESLDGARQFTMDLVTEGTGVEIVTGPQQVELAGLPGWYYLYRFDDLASGTVGTHAHYFLFDGTRMIVLVFQALPEDGFAELAPTFDAMATSLRVTPQE